jgi:hypothetical protein
MIIASSVTKEMGTGTTIATHRAGMLKGTAAERS